MKLSSLLSIVSAAAFVVAAPTPVLIGGAAPVELEARASSAPSASSSAVAVITQQVNNIVNQMTIVKYATGNYTGAFLISIPSLLNVASQSTKLGSVINAATQAIGPLDNLTLDESLAIAQPLLALPDQVNATLQVLVDKKPKLDHAVLYFVSASVIVRNLVGTLKTDTDNFANTLTGKLNPAVSQVAANIISQIDSYFANTLAVFQDATWINFRAKYPTIAAGKSTSTTINDKREYARVVPILF